MADTSIYVNEFTDPREPIDWAAADTETRTFIDGHIIPECDLVKFCKGKKQSWLRLHLMGYCPSLRRSHLLF